MAIKIDNYIYGCLTINKKDYLSDMYVTADHAVVKRKSTLAKTSLVVYPGEIEFLLKEEPEVLIIGTGKIGWLRIPKEIAKLCEKANVKLEVYTTKKATNIYNWYQGKATKVAAL